MVLTLLHCLGFQSDLRLNQALTVMPPSHTRKRLGEMAEQQDNILASNEVACSSTGQC